MNKKITFGKIFAIIFVICIVFLGTNVMATYNDIVCLDTDCETAQSNVQTMMQRRAELIPDLVQTVKFNAKHIENVYLAANAVESANKNLNEVLNKNNATSEEIAKADSTLTAAVSQLAVYIQQVPDLNDSEQVTALMDEIAGSVNRISNARTTYNDTVAIYNKKIRMFPGSIFASMFGFEKRVPYEATQEANQNNMVNFN